MDFVVELGECDPKGLEKAQGVSEFKCVGSCTGLPENEWVFDAGIRLWRIFICRQDEVFNRHFFNTVSEV